MRILFFIAILLLLLPDELLSQSAITAIEQGQDVNVLYRNEAVGLLTAHSRGFGASYRRLKHVTGTRKRFFEMDVLNMRHPKEYKVHYDGKGSTKGFYYGKLNSIFLIRGGIGFQNTLYERAERKSVEIRYSYSMGPNLTFAKPVNLYVFVENLKDPVIQQYDPDKHKLEDIAGRAPFVYGFDHTKVYPGAYAKLAFSFEYADYSNEVKAIETGVIADVYPVGVPTMAKYKREQFFLTLYISFVFGKKWF
ncbi:MAG: hypothetical protein ACJ76F_09740 [Bacteroidia bacterium]